MIHEPIVHIIDDDPDVRSSLEWLMGTVQLRVATYADASEFLAKFDAEPPGCIVLDVRMPGMSGLELQDELEQRGVDLPVIIITGHGEVPMAVNAMKAGAMDFLEKPVSRQLLLDRVHQAIDGNRQRRAQLQWSGELRQRLESLTPREREILDRIIEGELSKQIAFALSISERTVEAHRAKIMSKMKAESVADLVRKVLTARGQVDPPRASEPVGNETDYTTQPGMGDADGAAASDRPEHV